MQKGIVHRYTPFLRWRPDKTRIARDDKAGKESLAQYIMRKAFAEEKITYIEDTGQVLYRSAMIHGKDKKNFELLPAEEFIARITQHIPEKGF